MQILQKEKSKKAWAKLEALVEGKSWESSQFSLTKLTPVSSFDDWTDMKDFVFKVMIITTFVENVESIVRILTNLGTAL
jgi:hypothetical protein